MTSTHTHTHTHTSDISSPTLCLSASEKPGRPTLQSESGRHWNSSASSPTSPTCNAEPSWCLILLHEHASAGGRAVDSCSLWCSLVQTCATSYIFMGRLLRVSLPGPAADFWENETALQTQAALLLDHRDEFGKHNDKNRCLGSPQSRSDANFDMADLICSRLAFDHSGVLASGCGVGCSSGSGSGSECDADSGQFLSWLASAFTSNSSAFLLLFAASTDPAQAAGLDVC